MPDRLIVDPASTPRRTGNRDGIVSNSRIPVAPHASSPPASVWRCSSCSRWCRWPSCLVGSFRPDGLPSTPGWTLDITLMFGVQPTIGGSSPIRLFSPAAAPFRRLSRHRAELACSNGPICRAQPVPRHDPDADGDTAAVAGHWLGAGARAAHRHCCVAIATPHRADRPLV